MRVPLSKLLAFLRWIVSKEELEAREAAGPSTEAVDSPRRPSFWRRVFSPEALAAGDEAALPGGRRRDLALHRLLFATDELPVDPPRARPRIRLLPYVLARADLPEERPPAPPAAARRGSLEAGSLGWLLSRDRLETVGEGTEMPFTAGRSGISLRWLFSREALDQANEPEVENPTR